MVKEGREKDSWVSIGRYDFHLRFSSSSFSRFAYFHSLLFFPPSFSLFLFRSIEKMHEKFSSIILKKKKNGQRTRRSDNQDRQILPYRSLPPN